MRRSRRRTYRRKNTKKKIWTLVELAFLICLAVLLVWLAVRIVRSLTVAGEERAAREDMAQVTAAAPGAEPEVMPVFRHLLEQNPDTVGMVEFGLDDSLYVCQAEDNLYYRIHRFDGSEDPAGMIFMDWRNSVYPLSRNTILYGHNMGDGTRFGKLKRLEDRAYLEEHPTIRFVTLYEDREYEIFSVFHTTTDQSHGSFFQYDVPEFPDEAAFLNYVQAVQLRSLHILDVEVEYGDRLLTLATCSSELDEGMLIVVARETK